MDSHAETDIVRHATECAARLPAAPASFLADRPSFQQAFTDLVDAVRRTDARFEFDRNGRPVAINAVRQALPRVEREMFEALLEDHACEIAAMQEALYQIAIASGRR